MPQSVGVQISAPVLKLAVFVQHGGRPSAFRQNSADCHAETNSSFQMQTIRDSRSNHHVHWLQLANFSINELLLRLFLDEPICFLEILILLMCRFWRSNLEFQHCVGIAPKNHHKHTSLLIFQVIGGNFRSFVSNFCVFKVVSRDPWKSRAKIAAFQYPTECSETSTETKEIPT